MLGRRKQSNERKEKRKEEEEERKKGESKREKRDVGKLDENEIHKEFVEGGKSHRKGGFE